MSPMTSIIEFLALIVIATFVCGISLLAYRDRTLFELEFRDRALWRARGRIPPKLLHDFIDVCPRKQDARLIIRCCVEQGRARLIARGDVDQDIEQQLRNLLGLWPLARLKSSPKIRK
jgi:hypothetical protein